MTVRTDASPVPPPWLAHVPVPLFAAVMGLAGLGLAWRRAHAALGVPEAVGEAVMALAALVLVALGATYLVKLARFPRTVLAEFNHPVRVQFFPAISIGFLLVAAGAIPHHRAIAEVLWLIGTALHFAFALAVVRRWMTHDFEIQQVNPAWFIPIVGNIIVPIAGAPLGYVELSWLFFAVGLVFWVVLLAIVLYRVIFHAPLPGKLLPTLAILLAPPAIGFSGWLALNGEVLDGLGRTLFGVALFLALTLLTLARRLSRLPFAVSWWAFTFPSAAMSVAALRYAALVPGPATDALAVALLAAATIIVTVVAARTAAALFAGTLFVPEG